MEEIIGLVFFDELEENLEKLVEVELDYNTLMLQLDTLVENFEDSHLGLGEGDDDVSVLGDVLNLVREVFLEVIKVVFCVFFDQS